MSYSQIHRDRAINLRNRGFSYSEISNTLGIRKSTAYGWLKDIRLDSKARARIETIKLRARNKGIKTKNHKRQETIRESKKWAKRAFAALPLTQTLAQVFCSLLYWGEGGKFTDNRLEFTNSDPQMIRTYLRMLRFGFDVNEHKLRANVHIHEYHNEKTQKLFWHKITNIPLKQFNKSYQKPHTSRVIRPNYQGCVRICYYSGTVAKKVRALYQEISKI